MIFRNYHALFGLQEPGLEARAVQKLKTLSILKTDLFLTPKITDVATVYLFEEDQEKSLEIFKTLSVRSSKLKIMRMKGLYVKPRYNEQVAAKKIILNQRGIYSEISRVKKSYNITTLSTKPTTFKSMSYAVNLGTLLQSIRQKTYDKGIMMSSKIRASILELLKKEILQSSDSTREKILYFKGPFLTNTKIGLTVIDAVMMKTWNVLALFLEWFYKDPEGFKSWTRDNHVDIVLESESGLVLALASSANFQAIPVYNFKYVIRMIHRLDGSNLKAMGLTSDEVDEIEQTITTKVPDEVDGVSEATDDDIALLDEGDKLLPASSDDDDYIPEEDFDEPTTPIDVDEALTTPLASMSEEEQEEVSKKVVRDVEAIFNAAIPESEKATELLELHNYTALKQDMETPSVRELRKTMMKNYGKDVSEVVSNIKSHELDVAHFNLKVQTDYNHSTFMNLDDSYQKKLAPIDLENTLISPSNLSFPLFLKDYEKVDISDREFRGYLLKAKYETVDGEEVGFELEVPTVVNGSLFMGGSNKYLTNQDLAKPIIKVDENVIITMEYNKCILEIYGKYASAYGKMLVKTMLNFNNKKEVFKVKTTDELSDFIYANRVSYEMIHMNKHFGGLRYKENGLDIDFDFRGVTIVDSGLTVCGHINDQTIIHAPWKDKFWIGKDKTSYSTSEFIEHLLKLIDPELYKESEVKKLDNLNFVNGIYCTIMARKLPIILVMLIETPLKDLLARLKTENNLEYSIVSNQKLDLAKLKNTHEYGYIILEDFTIRIKYNNVINQLILVPLVNMDLTKYNVFDIAHIMKDLCGSDNTSIYLENFATSFVGPSSKRVLELYNMPSDFTGVFIYAASLFHDYKTYYASDATNYRLVTTSETINRMIYDTVQKEFTANVSRAKRGSRQTIKIPKDALIRSIQQMTNISEDSNISPFRSIMLKSSKSQKGHMGINMSRAFNMKRRMFGENNLGTETFSTAYSGQAGITKYLPFNPTFKDLTGTYNPTNDPSKLSTSAIASFSDSYIPYLSYDDSPRRIMVSGQVNHILAQKDPDPMLFSYGADEAAFYMVPEFSVMAQEDGVVESINSKFLTVKYKGGEIISYRLDNVERNAAKGYYLKNDFVVTEGLKAGTKFKKGASLAYNSNFFKKKANGQIGLSAGPLCNVVICDGEGTWEDSCLVSETISDRMSTKIVKRVAVTVDMSATDIMEVNMGIGSEVTPHTELIKYNDLTGDETLNAFFANVEGINTKTKEAHYKGILNDINVSYRTKKTTPMTTSVKQFIRDLDVVQSKSNFMSDLENNTDSFNRAVKTSRPVECTRNKFTKINGDVIEDGQMLIEFFIEVVDKVGPGDKIVCDRALKGEPTAVLKDHLRPYGELTGRVVDICLDNQSLNARKTPGLPLHGMLLAILLHTAVKVRHMLNIRPPKGSILDYKSCYDMVDGKLKYKD